MTNATFTFKTFANELNAALAAKETAFRFGDVAVEIVRAGKNGVHKVAINSVAFKVTDTANATFVTCAGYDIYPANELHLAAMVAIASRKGAFNGAVSISYREVLDMVDAMGDDGYTSHLIKKVKHIEDQADAAIAALDSIEEENPSKEEIARKERLKDILAAFAADDAANLKTAKEWFTGPDFNPRAHKFVGIFTAKADSPVKAKIKQNKTAKEAETMNNKYSTVNVHEFKIQDAALEAEGWKIFGISKGGNPKTKPEAVVISRMAQFTEDNFGEDIFVKEIALPEGTKAPARFATEIAKEEFAKWEAKATVTKDETYTPTVMLGQGSVHFVPEKINTKFEEEVKASFKWGKFEALLDSLKLTKNRSALITLELFGEEYQFRIGSQKTKNGAVQFVSLYIPGATIKAGENKADVEKAHKERYAALFEKLGIRKNAKSFNLNVGMFNEFSKVVNNTFISATHEFKEKMDTDSSKEYFQNVKVTYFSRIDSAEKAVVAMIAGAGIQRKDIKSHFKHMNTKAGLNAVLSTGVKVEPTEEGLIKDGIFKNHEIIAVEEWDDFAKKQYSLSTLFKARETVKGQDRTVYAVAKTRSPLINYKYIAKTAMSYHAENSMVGATVLMDGKEVFLSHYDAKKAIARVNLNPGYDKGVYLGKLPVAVLVGIENVDGSQIVLEQSEIVNFSNKHKLAAALAGGQVYQSLPCEETWGPVRIISTHHMKGVAKYDRAVKPVNELMRDYGVAMVSPMFKSSTLGLMKSVMHPEMDFAEFFFKAFTEEEFINEMNDTLETNTIRKEIGGIVYKFILTNENIFATDFYALQGWQLVSEGRKDVFKEIENMDVSIIADIDTDAVDAEEVEKVKEQNWFDQEGLMSAVTDADVDAMFADLNLDNLTNEMARAEEAEKEAENTVLKKLLRGWSEGERNYSLIAGLMDMVNSGAVEPIRKKGRAGVLAAQQIMAQYGMTDLMEFLNSVVVKDKLVRFNDILDEKTAVRVYTHRETANILHALYKSLSYIGYGSVSRQNADKKTAVAEFIKKFFFGIQKANGDVLFEGIANIPGRFCFTINHSGKDASGKVKKMETKFMFPSFKEYWNDQNTIVKDEDSLSYFAKPLMASIASLATMVRAAFNNMDKDNGYQPINPDFDAFEKANLTFAKYLEILNKECGGQGLFEFELPNAKNMGVVYQLQDDYTVHVNDGRWNKWLKGEGQGKLGMIKFPILMEMNFRVVNVKVKTHMSYENEAQRQFNNLIERNIAYVDPIMHMLNQDDADGDRISLFEVPVLAKREAFNRKTHEASKSYKYQIKYLLEEMSSLLKPAVIKSDAVKAIDPSEFEKEFSNVCTAKAMTGKHTNALINYTVALQGLVGEKFGEGANKGEFTQEFVDNLISEVGIQIQDEALSSIKHDKSHISIVENIHYSKSAHIGMTIDKSEAWKKLLDKMDGLNNKVYMANVIAEHMRKFFEGTNFFNIGNISTGAYGDERSYDHAWHDINYASAIQLNHQSFWGKVHNNMYAANVGGNIVDYAKHMTVVGKLRDIPHGSVKAMIHSMGAAGIIIAAKLKASMAESAKNAELAAAIKEEEENEVPVTMDV